MKKFLSRSVGVALAGSLALGGFVAIAGDTAASAKSTPILVGEWTR